MFFFTFSMKGFTLLGNIVYNLNKEGGDIMRKNYRTFFGVLLTTFLIISINLINPYSVNAQEFANITVQEETNNKSNSPTRPYKVWVTVQKHISGRPSRTVTHTQKMYGGLYTGTLSLKPGTYFGGFYTYEGYLYSPDLGFVPLRIESGE